MVLVHELLQAFKLFSLSFSMGLLVRGATIEGQGVVRVLWVLLVEDVVLTVGPVRVRRTVGGSLLDGLRGLNRLLGLGADLFALLSLILVLVRRLQVHVVRVDDLAFLLEVESFLVALNISLSQLAVIVLLVV